METERNENDKPLYVDFPYGKWGDHPELWLRHEHKNVRGWPPANVILFQYDGRGVLVEVEDVLYDDICSVMFDLAMTHTLYGGRISRVLYEPKQFFVKLWAKPSETTTNITPEFIEELSSIMKARKTDI